MKSLRATVLVFFSLVLGISAIAAQDKWPKTITASDGTMIKVFELQPESFVGNTLKARAVISVLESGSDNPMFGTFWSVSTVETDRVNRKLNVVSVQIPNLRFASDSDAAKINYLKTTLETQLPSVLGDLSLDEISESLDTHVEEKKLSKDLNNKTPVIYYAARPSILVTIDGSPKLKLNKDWGVEAVVNTPFTIVKNNDGYFYLYGANHWYQAASATGPYRAAGDNYPANLKQIADAVNNANNSEPGYSADSVSSGGNVISDIIVSTQPAELVQSKGDPVFTSIEGTNLQYVSNSDNDIFVDQTSQQYYVLLSGRWYSSASLQGGQWSYVASNALPADFAKIPEGSPKDNVLASIAGTDAAREAVMDAQIPQTAKVDRHNATADVTYDGDPQFDNIQGTDMQYAVNTQGSVIRYKNLYYCVDKGVWFQSESPTGPWVVCTERPAEVDIIPPSSPVYNVKYVYIYDVTPDWAYMGYTPGYLNTFIYVPTVVYGTGFYYTPWFGSYYYPRPFTWGFGVQYNPWAGWSLGWNYGFGWFNCGFGYSAWGGGWGGGWWGPSIYRPPYAWGAGYHRYSGFYGRNVFVNRNVRVYNNVNIYNYRRNVVTTNRGYNGRGFSNGRPVNNTGIRPVNGSMPNHSNIYSDRQGNVYQRNAQGQWQQREQRQWTPVNNNTQVQNLNRQNQLRDRGHVQTQNFQNIRSAAPPPSRPAGGGARPSGGGGGGARPSGGGGGGGRRH